MIWNSKMYSHPWWNPVCKRKHELLAPHPSQDPVVIQLSLSSKVAQHSMCLALTYLSVCLSVCLPILSYPILSYPILSYPILSYLSICLSLCLPVPLERSTPVF